MLIEQQTRLLVDDDKDPLQQYEKLRNAGQRIDFFRNQIALKMQDPLRSRAEALVQRIQNLNANRDNVIDRLWGGGMQAETWLERITKQLTQHCFVSPETSSRPNQLMRVQQFIGDSHSKN